MPLSQFDPAHYDQQLVDKQRAVTQLFERHFQGDWHVFPSKPMQYRMRAEFRLWHEAEDVYYVMFKQDDRKTPHRIDQFPVANETINRLMPLLLDSIKPIKALRHKLFQVEFLTSSHGECVISLIYHRQLDDEWTALAHELSGSLGVDIIGRARKQKIVIGKDYVTETLIINGKAFVYQQIENSFTQPNHGICEAMVGWACDNSANARGDLLELYCGNGNFTLPLAQHFNKVLATEISKTSIRSALFNAEQNVVDNVTLLRMSSEEFTEAWRGSRDFRRLEGITLADYDLETIFVDPPRAGLDEGTRNLAAHFAKIIYVSCNPETLARDIEALSNSHRVTRMALFDQFPYTHHAECGAIIERR
jgi:tRNA (uracil-5-)-methyltransferase